MEMQGYTITIFGLDVKDSLTIILSFLTLLVTVFVNVFMQIHWNRRKLAADLELVMNRSLNPNISAHAILKVARLMGKYRVDISVVIEIIIGNPGIRTIRNLLSL